jgi:hypothetical protein
LKGGKNMKVVINKCFGGFSLSLKGLEKYLELQGKKAFFYKTIYKNRHRTGCIKYTNIDSDDMFVNCSDVDLGDKIENIPNEHFISYLDIKRDDPYLIQTVEDLGEAASGRCSDLKIVDIPDDVDWEIDEYDGMETVEEKHRTWD